MSYKAIVIIVIGFLQIFTSVVLAGLSMFIAKQDLFQDLGLEFSGDIYMITDDQPSALLLNPKTFRDFVNPLPNKVNQIKVAIKWKPEDFHKKLFYSMVFISSDPSVVQHPKASINLTGVVFIEFFTGFTVWFPCSGVRTAQVDLMFNLNYSYIGIDDTMHTLSLDIRKNCIHSSKSNTSNDSENKRNNLLKKPIDEDKSMMIEQKIIISVSVIFFILLIVLVIYSTRCLINKQRIKKQKKFDVDYSFNVIDDELLSPDKKSNISDYLLSEKEDTTRPIFSPPKVPVKKHKNKWLRSPNKQHTSKRTLSVRTIVKSLDKIPEEDAEFLSCESKNTHQSSIQSSQTESSEFLINSSLNSRNEENSCAQSPMHHEESKENSGYEPSPSRKSHVPMEFVYPTALDTINGEMIFKFNSKWLQENTEWLVPEEQLIFDKRYTSNAGNIIHFAKVKGLPGTKSNSITTISVKYLKSVQPEHLERYLNEASLMRDLRHDNIMSLLGIVLNKTKPPLLLESYMYHKDLLSYLYKIRPKIHGRSVNMKQLVNFMKQISCGMDYLLSNGYTHNCLCAKHCMVSSEFLVKITNLQHAKQLGYCNQQTLHVDTPFKLKWAAIETFTDYICSRKTDVWSFGVTMWEIMTYGSTPYKGLSNRQVEEFLLKGSRLNKPTICSQELFELMSSCWQYNPLDRPSFNTLKNTFIECERAFSRFSANFTN